VTTTKNFKGENYVLLGYYAASSGNFLLTFRDNLSVSFSIEDGTDKLSRNFGKELQLLGACWPRRA
jgi:hypothetical protein